MSHSTYLFARPTFLAGLARTLDMGATFDAFNESVDGPTADAMALGHDWRAVGDDMRSAAAAWAEDFGVQTER